MTFTNLLTFYFDQNDVYKGFAKTEMGWRLYIHKLDVPYRVELSNKKLSYDEALEECASVVMSNLIIEGLDSVQKKWEQIIEKQK